MEKKIKTVRDFNLDKLNPTSGLNCYFYAFISVFLKMYYDFEYYTGEKMDLDLLFRPLINIATEKIDNELNTVITIPTRKEEINKNTLVPSKIFREMILNISGNEKKFNLSSCQIDKKINDFGKFLYYYRGYNDTSESSYKNNTGYLIFHETSFVDEMFVYLNYKTNCSNKYSKISFSDFLNEKFKDYLINSGKIKTYINPANEKIFAIKTLYEERNTEKNFNLNNIISGKELQIFNYSGKNFNPIAFVVYDDSGVKHYYTIVKEIGNNIDKWYRTENFNKFVNDYTITNEELPVLAILYVGDKRL